jgi:hypothetical protein
MSLAVAAMPPQENKTHSRPAAAAGAAKDSVGQFVAKFANHYRTCMKLAKRFTLDNPELKHSAAIGQLCRASQEMLEQAKEAQALTEIYLALDEKHRDTVRPIITARFKDISKLARASWRRFYDSIELGRSTNPEIESAQREFQPHADEFQEALQAFIAMSAKTH